MARHALPRAGLPLLQFGPMKCTTRLVPDEPASVDEFGAHQRVAEAVASLVRTEPGGRVIALEGPWGAGKMSTPRRISLGSDSAVEPHHGGRPR